jgi:hypothetical protein
MAKLSAKEEFKIGDKIDTMDNSNMGIARIRKVEGNSLFFTDEKGTDYQGFSRATARKLIEGGAWKRINIK